MLGVDSVGPTTPTSDLLADRYDLRRSLKTGNGVETYFAIDTTTGESVVLKCIDPEFVHPAARMRFLHETQVLRELGGLGLCALHDAGQVGDQLYLAQSFLAGESLEHILRRGPIGLAAALRIGSDVATALDIAHGAGVCHRDVKPANIIVDGTDPICGATLVDFGFARSPWLDEAIRDDLVGTIRYLAPESAGLLATPADERSDLYAVGVVLFECLAGRPLFPGLTVSDLLRQHLSMPAPELRTMGVSVPRAVDEVLQRLLRKDPAERYQSASALAADLGDLLIALEAGEAEPRLAVGRRDQRWSLTDPSFVGRYAEVDALATLVRGLAGDASGLVLVESDSGGGKSRLLNEVSQQASEVGVAVLHGQGVAQAGQRPFTLLHAVAEELVGLLQQDEPARQALNAELADVATNIVRALPALGKVLDATPGPDLGPEQFGELRNLAGLRRLLGAIASAERPVLLLLDDCQWADALTVRLLADLFSETDRPRHLGVVAAFRSEEVPADHALRAIVGAQALALGPLPPDAMAMLAESMAGPLPSEIVHMVVRLADGNPFMGAAVLRGLVESGALIASADGWLVDTARLHGVQAARRSAAFLVRRLELLSPNALTLLSVGAVLGKQFDIVTAVAVAVAVAIAHASDDAARIIADARRRRLLWVDERTGQCSFFHDKIREALLSRLDDAARRELHSQAADALAAQPIADDSELVFDLAYHLDAAGRGVEALPYAIAAATLARSRYALDIAVTYYRMAARTVSGEDRERRICIAEGLGDVLTLQGVYAEAEEKLAQARALVVERSQAASLDGKLGALSFKQGDIPAAKQRLEGALARLGRPIPTWSPLLVIGLVWELLVQTAHSALPRLRPRRSPDGHEDDFLAMRLYSRLAYLYWFHGGKIPCAWAHLRGMNLAERYPPSAELGQAYSEHAPVMTMLPWYGRGIRYAQRSLQIRVDLEDVWGQGQSHNFTGVVHYAASGFAHSLASCQEAMRLLKQTGDQWEVNTAGWNIALSNLRRGDLSTAAAEAREVFSSALSIGDQTSAGIALSVWTRALDGHVDARLVDEQLAKGGEDAQTTAELHLAAALCRRTQGDLDGAVESMRAAVATVRAAGLRQEYIAPIYPWFATIVREVAESTPAHNPALRRRRMRECARAVRRARRWAMSYRNNAPHALREAGLIASLRGRPRRATRLLRKSIEVARLQGARYELALSRAALAEVTVASGAPARQLEDARAEVRTFEPDRHVEDDDVPTISIFDRFATLLKVGHAIAAAASYPALEAAIRDSALALLRAERCYLVPVGALLHESLSTDPAEPHDALHGLSRSMLARAIDAGGPVVAMDGVVDTNESLVLSGIRSAIAVPIFVQDEPISCLYATHRQIGELFGEEEMQLAGFIATLAGAAFEHLLGSETRFRSFAQNSSDVITLLDRDRTVTYQSHAVRRVFALPADMMLGSPVTDWVHPDDLARFSSALDSAKPQDDIRVECRFRHADGTFRDAETIVSNLLDEPTVEAIVLNTRDITDRKRVEEQLREKNMELEKAGRAKDMFLASMSHELRTPLNAIIGFTGVLLMKLPGPLNEAQERQLSTVQRSGEHLLSIINDLLDLAKIESGAVELSLEVIDCVQVAESVVASLQSLADAKHLRLTSVLPSSPVLVRSDARALGQILINLVNNAIKFTDAGVVDVSLDAPPGGQPRIRVSDTGEGIDSHDMAGIFKAFERGKATNGGPYREGTGLGLHICGRLAELIGARIDIESGRGVGSVFTVWLPRDDRGVRAD